MKILGLIPARAGSQRLPGKNTAMLGNMPLIMWSIRTAQHAAFFDCVAVSTDDLTVANLALKAGCRVIDRPLGLGQADTPMLPVVRHALEQVPADIVVLLQPTSPFRSVQDIHNAYGIMTNADAVISVTDTPQDLVFEIGHANRIRPCKNTVVPNGALYFITAEHLKLNGDWYNGLTYAYKMPKDRSLDIDSPLDFEIAKMMVSKGLAA